MRVHARFSRLLLFLCVFFPLFFFIPNIKRTNFSSLCSFLLHVSFLLIAIKKKKKRKKTKGNAAGNGSTFFPLVCVSLFFSPARYFHFVQLWIQTNNQYLQIKQIDSEYMCNVIAIALAILCHWYRRLFPNASHLIVCHLRSYVILNSR